MRLTIGNLSLGDVKDGSNVIVYGAGEIGERLCDIFSRTNRVNLVAVIDKTPYKKMLGLGIPVCSTQDIKIFDYDYVVITLKKREEVECVKKELIEIGVDEDKMVYNSSSDYTRDEINEYEKLLERNIGDYEKRMFIFMVPEHGNTGDYAIEIAEKKFLKDFFPDYRIITVTTDEWLICQEKIKNIVRPDDIIFINGGGYIGNLWEDEPKYHSIVEAFYRNHIFFLPNTFSYVEKDYESCESFKKEMTWFASQKNIHVFFREKRSFDNYSQYCQSGFLYPDMVLYMHYGRKSKKRNGRCLLCLREDREKAEGIFDMIKKTLVEADTLFDEFDIALYRFLLQQNGEALVNYVCDLFQQYDVVITDRLHGMLLSVVSNVPCIALDNSTKKVSGVYDWIRDKGYALLMDYNDVDKLVNYIPKAIMCKENAGDFVPLREMFEDMAKYIKRVIAG